MPFLCMKWILLNLFGCWITNKIVVLGSENIALFKPTRQTSDYNGFLTSAKAVDGNPSTYDSENSHTLMPTDTPNWWVVDLESQYEITRIAVLNRRGVVGDNLRNFTVSVWQYDPGPHIKYNMVDTEYCVCINYPSTAPRETWTNLTCTKICSGRFVLVVLNNPVELSMCEFEVYGNISKYNNCSTQYLPETYIKKVVGERSNPPNCPLLSYQVSNVNECGFRCLQMNNCTSFNYSPPVINDVNCQLVRCFLHPKQDFTEDSAWNWRYLSHERSSVHQSISLPLRQN